MKPNQGESPGDPDLAREMAEIPYEPLLPIEKKLIAWSLVLGVVLLGVLWWLTQVFFSPEQGM